MTRKLRRWSLGSIALLGLLSATSSLRAQEVQAGLAEVPPPNRVTVTEQPASLARFSPQISNLKEQHIGAHHRPTPLEAVAAPLAEAAAPPPERPTSVRTMDIMGAPQPQSIAFFANVALPDASTNDDTSTVCEPSVAVRGQEVLYTANWFAAFSRDGGATFTYLNPYTTFPASSFGPFCCDQVAIYDPRHDLMIWFLQYVNDSQGNIIRIAVSKGNDIAAQNWYYYDFSPQGVGNWSQQWFDYPELALGEKYLYVTTNVFSTAGSFTRAVILRLPLAELSQYAGFQYSHYATQDVGSIRPVQGAGSTMYFGAHRSVASIRTFSWPENSANLTMDDVVVQQWRDSVRVAPGPDGRDWLGRADGRITAAWLSGDNIGFAWTASQDSQYAYPHVRVAILNCSTKAIVAQPHLWNPNFAYAYPAAAPNAAGIVGLAVHYGGNFLHPNHAVGTLAAPSASGPWTWDLVEVARGDHGPTGNRWGDYLSVRPHGRHRSTWVATGFTLEGGPQRTDVVPRYVHFGRGGPEIAPAEMMAAERRKPLNEDQLYEELLSIVRRKAAAEPEVDEADDEDDDE